MFCPPPSPLGSWSEALGSIGAESFCSTNIAEFCNDQVINRFYLVSWLVICIIRKIPHIMVWVYFWNIWIFELVFKNCLLFVCAWQDGRIKRKKNTASCYLDRIVLNFSIATHPLFLKKRYLLIQIIYFDQFIYGISSLLVLIRSFLT